MNYRLRQIKENAVYLSSDIEVYYYPRNSIKKLSRQYFRYGISKYLFHKKNRKIGNRQIIPILGVVLFSLLLPSILFLLNLKLSSILFAFTILVLYFYFLVLFARFYSNKNENKIPFKKYFIVPIYCFIIILILNYSFSLGYILSIFKLVEWESWR
jgi:hypothetical protein